MEKSGRLEYLSWKNLLQLFAKKVPTSTAYAVLIFHTLTINIQFDHHHQEWQRGADEGVQIQTQQPLCLIIAFTTCWSHDRHNRTKHTTKVIKYRDNSDNHCRRRKSIQLSSQQSWFTANHIVWIRMVRISEEIFFESRPYTAHRAVVRSISSYS